MKSVLIVDDEQIVLDVLQRILNRLGYETRISDSGEDAMGRFASESFDLVLMDVLMPEKNGIEVARRMREVKPDQKIIMVTGLGAEAVMAQNKEANVDYNSVLSKPFSFDKVRHILQAALDN